MMRDNLIDMLKGFAIVSMVVGHAIVKTSLVFYEGMLYKVIFSYHMPLFFSVSGYLMYRTIKGNKGKWLGGKAKKLLIPHFAYNTGIYFWSATGLANCSVLTKELSFKAWMISSTIADDGEWFLWTLFFVFALMLVVKWLDNRDGHFVSNTLFFLAIVVFVPIPDGSILRVSFIQFFFPFAVSGYLVAKYSDAIKKEVTTRRIAVAVPIILALFVLFRSLYGGVWADSPSLGFLYNTGNQIGYYALAALSVPLVYFGMLLLSRVKVRFNPLVWVGQKSIYIYLFSLLVTGLYIGSGALAVVTGSIFALGVAVALTLIVTRGRRAIGAT